MDYDSSANLNMDFSRIYNLDANFTKVTGVTSCNSVGDFAMSLSIFCRQAGDDGGCLLQLAGHGQYDPTSGNAYTNVPFTGHDSANLFLGMEPIRQIFPGFFHLRTGEKSLYLQDNFKASSRLILNFGVRYEYTRPATDKDNALLGFDPRHTRSYWGHRLPTW